MAILDGIAKKGAGRLFREASDYILGKNYQRIKLIHGVDGVNAGDVAASNPLPVGLEGATGAFGEVMTVQKVPQVQMKFPYNLNTDIMQACANNAGSSVTTVNGLATVTCANATEAFSQLRSLDFVRYGPGQGALMLGTAAFTTGLANSEQLLIVGEDDEGFGFGYNGTSFGVLRRSGGRHEIRELTITQGAVTAGGNITITMDDTAVVVAVENGDTIAEVCTAIVAEADFTNAGRGWITHTDDSISVEFISYVAENATGTFSFVDTDTTGVTAGVFQQSTTTVLGVESTDTWIAQESWNMDVMDGAGVSGMTLDQTKLNVYTIQYQYLGAGAIEYKIEDQSTGREQVVHRILYANTSVVPVLENPSLRLSLIAKTNASYAGGSTLVVKSSSMAGFVEGPETTLGIPKSAIGTKTITTTALNVLTIHSGLHFQGRENKINVHPKHITLIDDGTKATTINIIKNPPQVDGTVVLTDVDATNSVMQFDTAGTTVVGGDVIFTVSLSGGDKARDLDITHLDLVLRPGERWVFEAIRTSTSGDITISVSWRERI